MQSELKRSKAESPNLWVVLVNWNLPIDTVQCINSVLDAGVPASKVILIDNHSSDNSVTHFSEALPHDVVRIDQSANLGFAGGNNVGIQYALDAGAEWIMLLNNDTVVPRQFAQQIVEALAEPISHHLLSPIICYYPPASPDIIWSIGDVRLGGTLLTRKLWHNRPIPQQLSPILELDFATACSLIIHRTVFNTIGLLDTHYFMYGEDADFCLRAKKAHFRIGCVTNARIWHKVSRSTAQAHPRRRQMQIENQTRFYRRHTSGLHTVFLMTVTLIRCFALSLRDVFQRKDNALLMATWRAWANGWLRRTPL